MFQPTQRYKTVIAAIDAANADDPRTIEIAGARHPYEVVYADRMMRRLEAMYPDASEALRIAARGQHIRRFDIPRTRFPDGRDGYNEWRRSCREHHAELLREIMSRNAYPEEEVKQVAKLVKKEQLKKDKESQALENVVDVVFLEHYFDEFSVKYSHYDEAKIVAIIGKTLRKMSPKGHQAALALGLPERTRKLVLAAVEREAAALAALAKVAVD